MASRRQPFLESGARKRSPQRPFLFRVLLQLFLVAADTNEFLAPEADRCMQGRGDFQHRHVVPGMLPFMDAELGARVEQAQQPVFQLLVADLGAPGMERRANHAMRLVLDAPDQVRPFLAVQRRRIGQGRHIFADLVRLGVVVLELHPLRFVRQG